MPYTQEQIAKLKATDSKIVKQALDRMTPAQRDELMAAIQEGGTPETPPTPEMVPSHTPFIPSVPSHVQAAEQPAVAAPQPETTASGVAGSAARGLGPYAAGASFGVPGVATVAAAKMVGDPLTGAVNSLLDVLGVDPKYHQFSPSEAMGMLMDKMGIHKPQTATERIVEAGAGAAGSGLGVAKLGEVMAKQSVPAVAGIGKVLATGQAQQIAGGVGAGAASQAAAEMDAGPGTQLLAGLAGGLVGAKVGTPRRVIPPGGISPVIAEAEKAGINVLTTDVKPPQTFAGKWLQTAGEKIPWAGTGGLRRGQQGQRVEAIRDLLREFGADDAAKASDDVMRDLAFKRSADLTKYSNLKNGVITKLDQAGTVPVDNTIKAIDDQIAKLSALKTQEVQPVIARLADWREAIQGQSLENVELLRKQIGESFKAPDMAASRSLGEKALNSIYRPLRDDMGNFIKANGDRTDHTKWAVANKRLSEMMGELETGALKSVLKRGDATPEVVQKMLFSAKPSEVKTLYDNLSANGKQNARMAVLAKAAQDAGGLENISPEKFLTSVKKLGTPIGVVFEGQDAQRVKGLVQALKLTEHASKASLVPPTGVQAVPILAADVLLKTLGGPFVATGAAAGIGLTARAYESQAVRNILMKLPTVVKGSPEEAALMKRLTIAVQQVNTEQEKK